MSFHRLIAFGCSDTFGAALDDIDSKQDSPSKHSWPFNLAKEFNLEAENMGIRGASNKEILWQILNYNFNEKDIVFVLWSYPNRHFIIKDKDCGEQLGVWGMESKKNKAYYKLLYHDYDQIITNYFYYNLAKLYLQERNIKHIFLTHCKEFINLDIPWNSVKFLDVFFDEELTKWPKAKDAKHLGADGHAAFALKVFKKYNLNIYYTGDNA